MNSNYNIDGIAVEGSSNYFHSTQVETPTQVSERILSKAEENRLKVLDESYQFTQQMLAFYATYPNALYAI
ncbi:MAG: hypothetical protein AAFZ52_06490 [Bacteroidota bacterium]